MSTQDRIQHEIDEAREKARRDAASWTRALQRAQEQAEQSYSKGFAEGYTQGLWMGCIEVYEQRLGRTPTSEAELAATSVEQLRELAGLLRGEMAQGQRPLSGPSGPSAPS